MAKLYPRNYEMPAVKARNVAAAKARARTLAISIMTDEESKAKPAPVEYGELVAAMQASERTLTNDDCCAVLDALAAERYPEPALAAVDIS